MAVELRHEALAEAHNLPIALAFGVEVAAPLGSPQRQAGEAVFEDLLKAQEFQDGQVHCGVEPQAPLIGPNGGAELDPVAPVDPGAALVVDPGHPEADHPLRLHEGFDDAVCLVLRVVTHNQIQALQHLQHRLLELPLVRVPGKHLVIYILQICASHCEHPPFFPYFRVINRLPY